MTSQRTQRLRRQGDLLARRLVCGVESLDELLQKWVDHQYRPTLFCDDPRRVVLADLYDQRARELGLDVTAYRCRVPA